MVRLASLGLLAACSFRPSATTSDAAGSGADAAAIDAALVDSVISFDTCLGLFEHICVATPTTTVTLPAGTLDTDTSSLCVGHSIASQISACVVAGSSIIQGTGVTSTVTGTRPLILLSPGTISISGTLDLSSARAGARGAGRDPTACAAQKAPPVASGGTGGGGAGASFGGIGGDGAAGGDSAATGGMAAAADGTSERLRGGCPGYAGAGATGGAGGPGGGALYVLTTGNVVIGGTINASGAAGSAGTAAGGGGGGGGTGGMLVFEASLINVMGSAKIFANGGGGGEAANSTTNGNPGNESAAPAMAGTGGSGTSDGGNGGNGTAGTLRNASPGNAGQNLGGGGGGGGGAGLVKNYTQSAIAGSNVSPPPT